MVEVRSWAGRLAVGSGGYTGPMAASPRPHDPDEPSRQSELGLDAASDDAVRRDEGPRRSRTVDGSNVIELRDPGSGAAQRRQRSRDAHPAGTSPRARDGAA